MNELDAWKNFITTGKVTDYLKYASIKNSRESDIPQEAQDEVQHRRSGYTGTDNKGTGQANNSFDKK